MNFIVKTIEIANNFVLLSFECDPNPLQSSQISLTIFKSHFFYRKKPTLQKMENIQIKSPFPSHLKLEGLDPETHYKLEFILTNNTEKIVKNLHISTLHDENESLDSIITKRNLKVENLPIIKGMSYSEIALKMFSESKELNKDKKIGVLNARKCKTINSFINSGYKFSKPKELREIRKKRVVLVAESMELFEDIYKIKKEENQFKNGWFMGPFYVDNKNFKGFC